MKAKHPLKFVSAKFDIGGYGELHSAAVSGEIEKVHAFLEAGTFVNLKTKQPKPKTALELVIRKIEDMNVAGAAREDIDVFVGIADLLIDYGADITAFHDQADRERLFAITQRRLGIADAEIRTNYSAIHNTLIVKNCAAGDIVKAKLYNDFYNFLQSRVSTAITGLQAGASGEVELTTSLLNKLVASAFGSIPGIGAGISEGLKFYTSQIKFEDLKKKAAYFVSNKHIDQVVEDYCARMTEYYKEEILEEDTDLPPLQHAKLGVAMAASTVAEHVVVSVADAEGVKPEELSTPDTTHEDLLPHWEGIAARSILKLYAFLSNHKLDYSEELGKVAASGILEAFNFIDELVIDNTNEFSRNNAHSFAAISQLVYESSSKIEEMAKKWGFDECYVRQSNYDKSFIIQDKEKLVIAFRGTHYHEIHWLRDNIRTSATEMLVRDKTLSVHTGFHDALLRHWEGNASGERPLREIVLEYLHENKEGKVYITGHSLGGAMASIAYLQVLNLNIGGDYVASDRVCLYTYGQPRWCLDKSSEDAAELFSDNYYRIANYLDPVPYFPLKQNISLDVMGKILELMPAYAHLGQFFHLYKDGSLLDVAHFEQYRQEVDEDGYPKISDNFLSIGIHVGNHGMEHYVQKTAKVLKDFKHKVSQSPLAVHKPIIGTKATLKSVEDEGGSFDEESTTQAAATLVIPRTKFKSHIKMYLEDDAKIFTPFDRAIIEGNVEEVKAMIASGMDVNGSTTSPLRTALQYHQHQIARLLVKGGANINLKITHKEQNLLCYAAENGLNALLKSLLDRKEVGEVIDINERDTKGYSPLFYAVKNGNVKATKMLAEKADINELYDWNANLLSKAAAAGNLAIVKILLENGADAGIDHKDDYDNSALNRALREGHWEVVQCLILSKATTSLEELSEIYYGETTTHSMTTILHVCCLENGLDDLYLSVIKHFRANTDLWSGIEAEITDLAKQHNKIRILEDLYSAKPLFDAEGHHILAANVDISNLSMLYKSVGWDISTKDARTGININMVNGRGNTLLYELVEQVFTRDEDLTIKHINILLLITKYGADVNYTARSNGWTPLHLAVSSKQALVIEMLIKNNANYLLKDIHAQTPFDIAVLNEYTEILQSKELINHIIGDAPIAVEVDRLGLPPQAKRAIEEVVYLKRLQLMADERGCEYTVDYCAERLASHIQIFKTKYSTKLPIKLKDILSKFPEFQNKAFDDNSSLKKEEDHTSVTTESDVVVEVGGSSDTVNPSAPLSQVVYEESKVDVTGGFQLVFGQE